MLAFVAAAGWYVWGAAGAVAGVLAVTIPSSVLVVWLTGLCEMGSRIPWLQAVVDATIAAALGIMLAAVFNFRMARDSGSILRTTSRGSHSGQATESAGTASQSGVFRLRLDKDRKV